MLEGNPALMALETLQIAGEVEQGERMFPNRSMPQSTVIPVLGYPDVAKAVDWLCDVFGFSERIRIGNHRAQLNVGEGAVVVARRRRGQTDGSDVVEFPSPSQGERSHSVMVRVEDVDSHYENARQRGARVLQAPESYPFGERQYTAEDLGGHLWTFSQSIADVAPEEWGGIVVTALR